MLLSIGIILPRPGIPKPRNRFTDIKNKLVVTSGERGGGRGKVGVGD